jgi:hypothetical protein
LESLAFAALWAYAFGPNSVKDNNITAGAGQKLAHFTINAPKVRLKQALPKVIFFAETDSQLSRLL